MMLKARRLLGATALIAFSLTCGMAGCDITNDSGECERLRDYSCDCFPGCQNADMDVTNLQDDARCKSRLKQQYEYWKKGCLGRCELDSDCVFGWGSCAAGYYRQVGLTSEGICTKGGGGAGAGGATADVAVD